MTVGRIGRGDSTPSAEFMLRISKYFNMLVEDGRPMSRRFLVIKEYCVLLNV